MVGQTNKLEQLNQSLKKALGQVLVELLPNHPTLVVGDVLVDPSLRTARVWVTAKQEELAAINKIRPEIQAKITDKLATRYTFKLTFLPDSNYMQKIDQTFDQLKSK